MPVTTSRTEPQAVPAAMPALRPAYQPVVRLEDLRVVAHEGLVRRVDAPDASPLPLFDAARRDGRLGELELLAARHVVTGIGYPAQPGRLLVNLSAQALLAHDVKPNEVIATLAASGADLGRFVVELTERDIVDDAARLAQSLSFLRAAGIRIALDDFGNGHSNFELWHALTPEFVKIDRYLVDGVAENAGKLAIIKALVQVADSFGTELIAEGVEREADLVLLRDLNIRYAQGFLLGRPQPRPVTDLPPDLARRLHTKLPVRPRQGRAITARHVTAAHLMIEAPPVPPQTTNTEVARLFARHPELHALPVVDAAGAPLGLLNRRVFMEKLAQQYARELYGRRPCTMFMHSAPIRIEAGEPVEAMIDILRGEDQRYLTDGFIVLRDGRYAGIGTGESLVRRVSELRIEAARYANPLTLLPGNIPITQHADRLIETGRRFAAAYCDLNHFKPFNDQYGYFRGDAMIRLLADTLCEHVEPMTDFVGHVGGDDFVVLFQSEDWHARCEAIVDAFNAAARNLFDADDLARGGIDSEDRRGYRTTFPLTTLAIGVVSVDPGELHSVEDVAGAASAAKRQAKKLGVGVYVDVARPADAERAVAPG